MIVILMFFGKIAVTIGHSVSLIATPKVRCFPSSRWATILEYFIWNVGRRTGLLIWKVGQGTGLPIWKFGQGTGLPIWKLAQGTGLLI